MPFIWLWCRGRAGGRFRVVVAALLLVAGGRSEAAEPQGPWAVFGYAGRLTEHTWGDVVTEPQQIDWSPAGIAGVGLSYRLASYFSDRVDLELEGQVAKWFGQQHNWELDAPVVVGRWTRFPWDERVATSAAFGLGLSWQLDTPRYELIKEGETSRLLAYWMIEIEAGPPRSVWSGFGRLHHRSTAFGTFAEDGGANSLVLGVRRRF